jgi:hypothetical protein
VADNRGGYRLPRDRRPRVSGVGSASRRTDGQPVNVPNVGDAEDLKHGDRQMMEASLRKVPLPRGETPRIAEMARANAMPPMSEIRGGGGIPDWLTQMETNRPEEALNAGGEGGMGSPPDPLTRPAVDDREAVLQWLARGGNQDALDNLHGYRDSLRPPDPPPSVQPAPVARIPDDAVEDTGLLDDGLGEEEDLASGEVVAGDEEELSVETPAASSEEPPVV